MDTYKVLKNFRDKENDMSLHQTGEEVKLSKTRGQELTEKGFVELVSIKDDAVQAEATPAKGAKTKEEKSVSDKE